MQIRPQFPKLKNQNPQNSSEAFTDVAMADKVAPAGPSAVVPSQAPAPPLMQAMIVESDLIAHDADDDLIIDELYHSVMDTILFEIADQMQDGEALAVLHLTAEILEAEEKFGGEGTNDLFPLIETGEVNKGTELQNGDVNEDTELQTEEEDNVDSELENDGEVSLGDYEEASDFFDCFEGVGIGIVEGQVSLKRRIL